MTPEWVVKNFLPDYHQRHEAALSTISERAYMRRKYAEETFVATHFPEALGELLKAQRYECADHWHNAIAVMGEPYYESIASAICNAPVPEVRPVTRECTNTNPGGLHEYREGCGQNCDECDYYQPVKS